MQTISFLSLIVFNISERQYINEQVKFISIMSSVTYFVDLIASIKKETFISFKIQTIKFGT